MTGAPDHLAHITHLYESFDPNALIGATGRHRSTPMGKASYEHRDSNWFNLILTKSNCDAGANLR